MRILRPWPMASGAALLLLVAQIVPYGRQHSNPSVTREPPWDSSMTRALAQRACFDCHSNETEWPPYSHVAPVSWLIQRDVDEGRAVLNFSEWERPQEEAAEAADVVNAGEMPPVLYRLVHGHARLSESERARLAEGLALTLGTATDGKNGHNER